MIGFATVAKCAGVQLPAQAVLSLTSRGVRSYIGVVKWRNQLLALFCLLLFAVFGVFYFRHWVIQKPFGIVLFIGEGLGPERLAPTRIYGGGVDVPLALDSMAHLALLTNYSADFSAPDRAAAATAIATGKKVNNRSIGLDPDGKTLANLMDLARQAGRATGLVTDGNITDPTAAAFYAHVADQTDKAAIALQSVEGSPIDLVLGGGAAEFLPETKNGHRRDERDLLLEIRRAGFDVVRSKADLEAIPGWRRPKLFGLFAPGELGYSDQIEARSEEPGLADMVRRAIELLQYNRAGYFLVVDASLMRKAAQDNDGQHTLAETLELDRAVAMARRYVGATSAIFVCGDVAIGGLTLNGHPFRKDRGIAVLGFNAAGDPWLSWAAGPRGNKSYGAAKLANSNPSPEFSPRVQAEEPVAFYAPQALETVEDVLAFGNGPGTDRVRGSMDNTVMFQVIRDNF